MPKTSLIFLFLIISSSLFASPGNKPSQAAIASAHPMATQAGFEILDQGGNAFDAAVAVSATLAVVEPYSSGIGGGGFWLLHDNKTKKDIMIDGREIAPLKATRNMYLDKEGNVVPGLSVNGALAAGIPGEPAALIHIAKKYGRLSLAQSLAPAIRAASKGFIVTEHYRRMAGFRLKALQLSEHAKDAAKIFLKNNQVPPLGFVIKQPDLAKTLNAMAKHGHKGFYAGEVAKKLVTSNNKAGGIWSLKDLKEYKVKERQPIVSEYKGYRLTSVAPPSSGGVALAEMLNILSFYNVDQLSTSNRIHVIVEAMRRTYRDRAEFLGDSDYINVPVKKLTSKNYAKSLQQKIDFEKATPSSQLKGVADTSGGNHTTHFSILDKQGHRVAATLSVNYPFGSGFVAEGTGVLLNDEMDDFSAKPGVPNVYGLVGAEANAIEPGKRMLSSMSPTFIESEDKLAVIGTPGGSRIITMVLHGILATIEGKTASQIVNLPRYHHQYLPDVIQYEPGTFSNKTLKLLKELGHKLNPLENSFGNMQVVIWDKKENRVTAASDKRGEGVATVK
ncbi:MAG: gamma-glutamyltransferase [Gammaproteobacteria bacterium]|nr:gamma-glutamyltransferase [Gammaproteobacteria bacterium]